MSSWVLFRLPSSHNNNNNNNAKTKNRIHRNRTSEYRLYFILMIFFAMGRNVNLQQLMGRLRLTNGSRRLSSSSSRSTSVEGLNIALLTGTTRRQGPPNPINGHRVATYIQRLLEEEYGSDGGGVDGSSGGGGRKGGGHNVTRIDPTDFPLLEKPEFCYAKSQVPPFLSKYRSVLVQADAIICITPEYNHGPSPGLVNMLNHFGSSVVSFKPSGIVSYSAGQWGGTRAAVALRPILSEMGCLPVSAMIHIPYCQDVLDENGNIIIKDDTTTTTTTDRGYDGGDDGTASSTKTQQQLQQQQQQQRWDEYCRRCFSQVEWWATAARNHKQLVDPFQRSKPFQRSPSQRDAPS